MFLPNSSIKDFYSVKEFASLLGLHENTIRTAIKNGRINAFRIGASKKASYRISRTEINRIAELDLEDMIERTIENRKLNDY